MHSDRRDIHRSAKTGTVTRETARVAVLAAKSSHADKNTPKTDGRSTSAPSSGSKHK